MWVLELPLFAGALLFTGYLVVVTAAAIVAHPGPRPGPDGPRRQQFAVVIPALNGLAGVAWGGAREWVPTPRKPARAKAV